MSATTLLKLRGYSLRTEQYVAQITLRAVHAPDNCGRFHSDHSLSACWARSELCCSANGAGGGMHGVGAPGHRSGGGGQKVVSGRQGTGGIVAADGTVVIAGEGDNMHAVVPG